MSADTLENNVVKICLVTDIHHGENNYSGEYNNALPLIKKFNVGIVFFFHWWQTVSHVL